MRRKKITEVMPPTLHVSDARTSTTCKPACTLHALDWPFAIDHSVALPLWRQRERKPARWRPSVGPASIERTQARTATPPVANMKVSGQNLKKPVLDAAQEPSKNLLPNCPPPHTLCIDQVKWKLLGSHSSPYPPVGTSTDKSRERGGAARWLRARSCWS